MKMKNYNKYAAMLMAGAASLAMGSCDDYLDITPPSNISPEVYFLDADQLANYTINYYTSGNTWSADDRGGAFPFEAKDYNADSYYHDDNGTDNESGDGAKSPFSNSMGMRVGASGGLWYFNRINDLNYFIRTVKPKVENGEVSGDPERIKHYLGEGYVLRANEYFFRMRKLGDLPIITHNLPMDRDKLAETSKRCPRNLVARFILSDLDTALTLLSNGAKTGGTNRITRDAALLLKARVALYEATFEKYFAGTPFVPDAAAGWPGATKAYNEGFSYDNQAEVSFFLDQAMAAAKEVADAHPLASNNKRMIGGSEFSTTPANDYYNMFAGTDASSYSEVLMWHAYNTDLSVSHQFNKYVKSSSGYTQEFANAFLMESGLPIYAANDYMGDDYIADTKENRDWRWRLFMKAPGEYIYENSDIRYGAEGKKVNGEPSYVPAVYSTSHTFASRTGYGKGKMFSTNLAFGGDKSDMTNTVIFRSAEAYLIYMEAAWEKYGDALDGTAWSYWKELRKRAGVGEPQVTIDATDLDKEWALTKDLGLYSAGTRITSKVLFNIRRERRCEFISEGHRMDDLIRWRALDQLCSSEPGYIGEAYYLHGCKMHGPMADNLKSKTLLKYDQADDSKNNVSSPNDATGLLDNEPKYLSLYRIHSTSQWYQYGMCWHLAHYLSPIAQNHFLESSPTGSDIENSPIYQNPYWGTDPQSYAER